MARSTVSGWPAFSSPSRPMASSTPSSTLRLLTLIDVVAARDAEPLQRVGRHHADFGVGRDEAAPTVSASNCMNWRKRPGPGFSLRNTKPDAIAAIGLGQRLEILGDVAGERRGQVVAQRQPLLVVVLEREHALVGPVLVGQELAERLGVFDRRRLDRLEAVELVDLADRGQHAVRRGDLGGVAVGEAARQARLDLGFFFV